jgi:uncharacterized protein
MKVFIDIYHLPQLNLFKNAIIKMGSKSVDIGCVNRGKLVDVIRHELPDFRLFVFGDYKNNKGPVSMVTKIIIPRALQLINLFRKQNYNMIGSASYQANVAAKILGIPNFSILDDPRIFMMKLLIFATRDIFLPPFSNKYGKVKQYNALKEWAYLSPTYFRPSKLVLKEYNLSENNYLFMREVATDTINYLSQEKSIIQRLSKTIPLGIKVVLSLEDKRQIDNYPNDWIVLTEPVSDIHSLMYYSKIVISSGDSMAREGSMLGVSSIYLGNRDMPANQILIDKGILKRKSVEESVEMIKNQLSDKSEVIDQNNFRAKLQNEWDDITQLTINLIGK